MDDDFKIDPKLLEIDTAILDRLGDPGAELDRLLASVGDGPDLGHILGMEAGDSLQIDRVTLQKRHIEDGRLLQRVGLEFFAKKNRKPPKCA